MRKVAIAVLFTVICILTSTAYADNKDVIKAFIRLKSYTEIGVTPIKYSELLGEAKTQISIAKESDPQRIYFLELANFCLNIYMAALPIITSQSKWFVSDRNYIWNEGAYYVGFLNDTDPEIKAMLQSNIKRINEFTSRMKDMRGMLETNKKIWEIEHGN